MMATKQVTLCDICKNQIREGGRFIFFKGTRWAAKPYDNGSRGPATEFDGEFCSDACVISAVRGLLNGS